MIYLVYILWICAILSIIAVAFDKKKPDVQYSHWDIFSYVLDAVSICFFLFLELQFIASGFAGTVEGFEAILCVLDYVTLFLLPVSFFTIAGSIFLRKRGKNRQSWLVQLSTVPIYLICLAAYHLILF